MFRAPKTGIAVLLLLFFSDFSFAKVLLNGIAPHSELGAEMFIAGLYVTTPSTDKRQILLSNEEKQIQVRVTAERLSTRRFRRMWIEGMAVNASTADLKAQSGNMAAFSNMLKIKLAKGDNFAIDRYETLVGDSVETSVRVSINGAVLGEISDAKFFDLLLRTWLGPVPLSSLFRENLLKRGSIESDLLARYDATTPSDERIAAVQEAARTVMAAAANPASTAKKPKVAIPDPVTVAKIAAPKPQPVKKPPPIQPKPKPEPKPEQVVAAALPKQNASSTVQKAADKIAATVPAAPPEKTATKKSPIQVAKAAPASVSAMPENLFDDEEDEPAITAESILGQQLFVSDLKKYSYGFLKYPKIATQRGYEGNIRMNVVIDRQGNILDIQTLEKSKYNILNKAALRSIKKADPFPPVPKEVPGESFTFTLPIVFQMKR